MASGKYSESDFQSATPTQQDPRNIFGPIGQQMSNFMNTGADTLMSVPSGIAQTVMHPYKSLIAPLNALTDQANREVQTSPNLGILHYVEGTVPVLGPLANQVENQVRSGNY